MTARNALRALLAAPILSLALAPGAQAAQAVNVSCGETITVDTKLANDLTECPSNGIVIGADGITLDLNGHTVDGDGAGDDLGIDNTAGHDGVTIEGGSVQGFVEGVLVVGGSENRLRHLSSSHNSHAGIALVESASVVVESNYTAANCVGMFAAGSRDVRIEHNSAVGNACLGLGSFDSEHIRLADNSVSHTVDPAAPNEGLGMGAFDSNDSVIEANRVSSNGFAGVLLEHSDDNQVSGNMILKNRNDLIVIGDRNIVTRNRVLDALGNCDDCGFGISFEGGHDNLIAENIVKRARLGIRLAAFEPDTPPAVDNAVRSNLVADPRLDGILVESSATFTQLERNLAVGAADDGIDVDNSTTSLTRNTANHNHDLGIEAVPGVTDGGGNKAGGNGNPLQCTNVFCK